MADYFGLAVLGGIFTFIIAIVVHLLMNRSVIDSADREEPTKQSTNDQPQQEDDKKKKKKKALEKMAKRAEDDDEKDNDDTDVVLTQKDEQKAQRKAQRDEYKRQQDQLQEEQRLKMEAKSEKQRLKDEEREAAQAAKEEEERKRKEEQARKDQEEFDKWKDLFTVEQGGSVEQDIQMESQSLLTDFVNHIKQHKVVVLESLASHFGLRTQEVIQRIQRLEKTGMLTGVMDDKGKFIYITEDEMRQVADFIRRRGRVSVSDIARESNRLIDLEQKATANDKAPEINLDDLDVVVDDPATTGAASGSGDQDHVVDLELDDLT